MTDDQSLHEDDLPDEDHRRADTLIHHVYRS